MNNGINEFINMHGEKKYAEIIILEYNFDKIFHYCIPQDLKDRISLGSRVTIPFRGKVTTGCVVGFLAESDVKSLKDIRQIIDKKPLLTPQVIRLTKWISNYYLCSWEKILNYAIPKTRKSWLNKFDITDISSLKLRLPEDDKSSDHEIIFSAEEVKESPPLKDIENIINNKKFKTVLIRGNDFKSRMKIYLSCIRKTLKDGMQSIILAPTESHLSELAGLLEKEFKDNMVVFDEKIDQKSKYQKWIKIRNSQVNIALGMRSSIFVPFDKLGLIIVEREHSGLYKEERSPRYNAREVALKRAELENIPLILSSETPSMESYWNVQENNFLEADLNTGGERENLLKKTIIDMTKEKSKKKIISYELQQAISRSLKNKRQVVLFLNKRGFSSFMICSQCGHIPKCSDCNTSLSYHLDIQKMAQLICHNCGKRAKVTDVCAKCGSKEIRPLGMGTQKLESEIRKMFTQAEIRRLDRDSLIKDDDYRQILEEFNQGNTDILIGTQMVLKGVDFNNVDLIGIISADTLLNLPDYRSGEKTFQLLSEVISSFREIRFPKEVIIQTFNPEDHCIVALKEQDYNYFYQKEVELRKELDYPPFTHIIKIVILGEEKEAVRQRAEYLISYLESLRKNKESAEFKLLGDVNMVLWKSRNDFKVQFLVKVKDLEKFNQAFKKKYDKMLSKHFNPKNRLTIDVDPIRMI
ncbi:MAG: Primosomal protein N [Atribacteria bacterium 34_128]|nr:MAG: Primosomal protein N [Atribacteria bacterium 34_128]